MKLQILKLVSRPRHDHIVFIFIINLKIYILNLKSLLPKLAYLTFLKASSNGLLSIVTLLYTRKSSSIHLLDIVLTSSNLSHLTLIMCQVRLYTWHLLRVKWGYIHDTFYVSSRVLYLTTFARQVGSYSWYYLHVK